MAEFHFLRPLWLWLILPVFFIMLNLFWRETAVNVWSKVCDAHLLQPLLVYHGRVRHTLALLCLFLSITCMIIALAGPSWSKIVVPTYQHLNPRVILLDLSTEMLEKDMSPDRLTRARFKVHDLLMQKHGGQWGLMVYSNEPFVVSPLTDDAQTIDILLSSLSPSILPVDGNRLEQALLEAQDLFTDVGFRAGDILVLTGHVPSAEAVDAAQRVAEEGYTVSVMPMMGDQVAAALFAPLAKAGRGAVITFSDSDSDIQRWLRKQQTGQHYHMNQKDDISLWRDQGRWFLLPGLILWLPMFRRGWFEGISA